MILLIVGVMIGVMLWRLVPHEQSVASTKPHQIASTDVSASTEQLAEQTAQVQLPIDLGDGLFLTGIRDFSGIYMEDGTDDVVQGLLSVVLENRSTHDLQYAQITLDYGDEDAAFEVTNLPSGGQVVLLEKSRMTYREDQLLGAYADQVAMLEQFPMYPDLFEISTSDNIINVRNISGEDISGDIFVYYKNVGGGIYYGGITYRVRIEGGLKAGEIRQVLAVHYYEDTSEILMVSYGA